MLECLEVGHVELVFKKMNFAVQGSSIPFHILEIPVQAPAISIDVFSCLDLKLGHYICHRIIVNRHPSLSHYK
jgi:hypothetical protein